MRTRESKTRNQRPVRQPRQKVLLLHAGAVPRQQFAQPQRIGNGHGGIGVEALRRQLGQHATDRVRAEPQAAPFLRYFHPEEFFIAHVVPCLFGEVLVGDYVVVVEEGAEGGYLVVDEGFFCG